MSKTEDTNVDELIKNKFYCARKFTEEIEKVVLENKDMKYVDAIVFFCEKNNLDVESVPKLITKPLKEKLPKNLAAAWVMILKKRLIGI